MKPEQPILINCVRMHDPRTGSLTGNFSLTMHLIEALQKLDHISLFVHADAVTLPFISTIMPADRIVSEPRPVETILQMELAVAKAIRGIRPVLYHKLTGQLPLIPAGCRTVWGVADLGYRHLPMGMAQRIYKHISYRISARRAGHIIAISNSVRNEIISALCASPQKVSTVYCGTSELTAEPEPMKCCRRAFLLTFGHQRHKNVETCIEVAARLKQADVPVDLVVAGKVERQDFLQSRAAEAGVSDCVHFPGRISEGQLRYLYQHAICLLFLSRHEGFGLPVLEAMGEGCPVIASRVFSLPEVVGTTGPMFDCDDARGATFEVLRLMTDPELRKTRIQAGYANTTRFSWTRAAQETIAVYQQILQGDGQLSADGHRKTHC